MMHKKKVIPDSGNEKAKPPVKPKVVNPVGKLLKYMKEEQVMFFWGTIALLGGNAG
jgi:hypothetical protein